MLVTGLGLIVCLYQHNNHLLCKSTEEGSHNGYPKFVEQNKNDGTSFGSEVTGAQIVYCSDIGAWVFNHPYILTSSDGEEENECSWLWRSQETDDYELTSTSGSAWEAWVGRVKPLVFVSITCNECSETSDCNYHGTVSPFLDMRVGSVRLSELSRW